MKAPKQLTRALAIGLLTSAIAAGCALPRTRSDWAHRRSPTALHITNYHWQNVRVYLLPAHGVPTRIGSVGSMTSSVIQIRGALAAELRAGGTFRFLIRPLASRTSFTTHSVLIGPEDEIQLNVENRLSRSTILVHRR
ncbi:MAG: hypothetical protein IH919_03075 [Deltaproteobacteria bacterium]|nr:hypothetical protein [Deltaproteobacteria bacterium]